MGKRDARPQRFRPPSNVDLQPFRAAGSARFLCVGGGVACTGTRTVGTRDRPGNAACPSSSMRSHPHVPR